MAFPKTALDFQVRLALGAAVTGDPTFWTWTDITAYVLASADQGGDGIVITRGRGDEFANSDPETCTLTLNNAGGRFCPANPTGPYYGRLNRATPLQVRVNNGAGYVTVYTGFVEDWPPRWTPGLVLQTVTVTAAGTMRRLMRASTTAKSAFTRALSAQSQFVLGPYAYWPMEDQRDSTGFAFGLSEQAARPTMLYADFDLAADDKVAGSLPLPVGGPNGQLSAQIDATRSTGWAGFHEWNLRWLMRLPASPSTTTGLMAWSMPGGTIVRWVLNLVPGSPDRLQLMGQNAAGTDLVADPGVDFTIAGGELSNGAQLWFEVNAELSGSDTAWNYTVYAPTGSVSTSGTVVGVGTFDNWAVGAVWHSAFPGLVAGGYTVGQIAVANGAFLGSYGLGAAGATGYARETTADRHLRLTAEREFQARAGVSDTLMGPQQAAGLLDMLRDIEAAEGGVLYEGKDGALVLQTRADRYNSAVALALDFPRHVAEPFEPAYDDQYIRNRVEVSALGGSNAEYVDQLSVASLNGAVYEDRIEANLFAGEDLVSHGAQRASIGGGEDLRYPSVTIKLHANPSLINTWLGCDVGSRVTITHPPAGLPPDLIDLLIEGYTERLSTFEWVVTLNTAPAGPWQTIVLDDADSRVDGGGYVYLAGVGVSYHGTVTVSDLTASQTTIAVKNYRVSDGDELKWLASATPFNIVIDGEEMTVTNVTDNPITFVGSGTAAHAVNAAVTPGMPAGATAGDMLMVFGAIRNDATGLPDIPAGYDSAVFLFNSFIFTRIMQVGDTAPTITFTGGGAGDDTSAQMAAFRNVDGSTWSTGQFNGSGADIAYPALEIIRPSQLVIVSGWKQDDWTSVATLAGFTEIGEPDTTTGNDQGIVWDYQIQTTATSIPAGSFTVTGGAAAISSGNVVTFAGTRQTLTVVRGVNGVTKAHSAGATVGLYRPRILAL